MFELQRLQREMDSLNSQLQSYEQRQQAEREREVAADIRERTAQLGFASASAAEDFQRLMTSRVIAGGLPEHVSLAGFLRQELQARPPYVGSYRPDANPASEPQPAGAIVPSDAGLDLSVIRPGMSKTEFEAVSREIGRCLQEQTGELR